MNSSQPTVAYSNLQPFTSHFDQFDGLNLNVKLAGCAFSPDTNTCNCRRAVLAWADRWVCSRAADGTVVGAAACEVRPLAGVGL